MSLAAGRPSRFHLTGREWWLFALLLLCYVYFFPRYADWNQNSRVDLILAIVEQGRLEIDSYAANTGDYAEFNGHRYSDKAPGPALLGVPVYAAARPLLTTPPLAAIVDRLAAGEAFQATLKQAEAPRQKLDFAIAQMLATWTVISLPAAMLGVCLYRALAALTPFGSVRLLVALSYALATSAFPYAGNFYSHQLSAALLFTSFVLLWQGPLSRASLALVGLLLGLALISEYSTVLIVAALILYAGHRTRHRRALAGLLAGLAPPLAVMSAYNYAIFRTPLPVGYAHSTLWQAEHSTGFFSLTYPQLSVLWDITFSPYRGLFFLSPILLLGLVGLGLFYRVTGLRAEWLVCAWSVGSFLAFNAASAMPYGGFGVGPRYLVPMLPFLALPMALVLDRWSSSPAFRGLLAALLGWSVFAVWVETLGTQSFPTFDPNPLWNLSLPSLLAGDVARNWGSLLGLEGLWSLLPLLAAAAFILVRLVRSAGLDLSLGPHAVTRPASAAGPLSEPAAPSAPGMRAKHVS